jgi:ParB-like chromosome segregation protein Spo0J
MQIQCKPGYRLDGYKNGRRYYHICLNKKQFTAEGKMTESPLYEIHPLANIFPEMQVDSYICLREDIRRHGQFEPIRLYEGKVIDGRHRLRACIELGIAPQVKTETSNELISLVISLNLHRRHLSETQRGMIAAKLANMQRTDTLRQHRSANLQNELISQSAAANLLNVSPRTVASAVKVRNSSTPELIKAVEDGKVSLSAAVTLAELSADEQRDIIKLDEKSILQEARIIRGMKRQKNVRGGSELKGKIGTPRRIKISEDAWHLWGRLHDLETAEYLTRDPEILLSEMSDFMLDDIYRAVPEVIGFLKKISELQRSKNRSNEIEHISSESSLGR